MRNQELAKVLHKPLVGQRYILADGTEYLITQNGFGRVNKPKLPYAPSDPEWDHSAEAMAMAKLQSKPTAPAVLQMIAAVEKSWRSPIDPAIYKKMSYPERAVFKQVRGIDG